MDWDVARYQQFRDERLAPAIDLIALIDQRDHARVVDLGCGAGEITAILANRLPGSTVLGIDSSPAMIAAAEAHAADRITFRLGDLQSLDGAFDVIFSNATLQWIPDHHALLRTLWSHLAPGGQLTVQVPANHRHPSQTLMAEIAHEPPFATALAGYVKRTNVLELDQYAELLHGLGGVNLEVIERVYPHELTSAAAMVAFVESTVMRPYLERLPAELHQPFKDHLIARLTERFPGTPAFFGFRRILFAATNPG
ncbi:MAG: methyltransferase domain-containing protein [bacterium]